MKKIITTALCLLITLSLAACGSQEPSTGENSPSPSNTSSTPTSQPESSEPTDETEESSAPEDASQPEDAVTFDSGWTTNAVAMNIPEPPAEYQIAEKQSDDTFCLIEIKYATCGEIKEYGDYLQSCGFNMDVTVNESQSDDGRAIYNFKGKNADGCSVRMDFSEMDGDYTLTYMEIYLN